MMGLRYVDSVEELATRDRPMKVGLQLLADDDRHVGHIQLHHFHRLLLLGVSILHHRAFDCHQQHCYQHLFGDIVIINV